MKSASLFFILLFWITISNGQNLSSSSQKTPTYGQTKPEDVKRMMDRILKYLDQATPVGIVNRETGTEIRDLRKPEKEASLVKSEYGIVTHEWGLTYSAMLISAEVTGDVRYADYVKRRFEFLAKAAPYFRAYKKSFPGEINPLDHFLFPKSLDDTGSMCAAMIQSIRSGIGVELRSEINNSIRYIMNDVYQLSDGTFARNRPLPNSVWVDDLYQGIPALAEMGKLTGDRKYFE